MNFGLERDQRLTADTAPGRPNDPETRHADVQIGKRGSDLIQGPLRQEGAWTKREQNLLARETGNSACWREIEAHGHFSENHRPWRRRSSVISTSRESVAARESGCRRTGTPASGPCPGQDQRTDKLL